MKKPNGVGDTNQKNSNEVYINHGLTGSRDSLDIDHSNSSQILHDSYESHQEIQGSSDFIRKQISAKMTNSNVCIYIKLHKHTYTQIT